MNQFLELQRYFKRLTRKDCQPTLDSAHHVAYGYLAAPFQLEVAYYPKNMIIRKLFIRRDFQDQGLGRRIVEILKHECQELYLEGIELDTILPESAEFWKRCGFSIYGCRGYWSSSNG
jgi:GNAT superfamily N-acetyltransferase